MWLESPQAPSKAIYIEQISPSNRCHLSTPMRFWLVVISARISLKRFSWCGGKENFMFTVSITHPRRTWKVDHAQFLDLIFFSNNNSLGSSKSPESQVHNTLSRE